MNRTYEVTTVRLTRRGQSRRTRFVEAEGFTQDSGTASFTDDRGRLVVKIKHVVRICWP